MLMLCWFIAKLNPAKHPPPFPEVLLLGTAGIAFLFYFLTWLIPKCGSQIIVFDHWIVRFRGFNTQITFADLTSFSWRSSVEYSTLVFTDRRGRQILVGVPHDISTETLSAFLSERIFPFVTKL